MFPAEVTALAHEAHESFRNDIDAAVASLEKKLKKAGLYEDAVPSLIKRGMRSLIHDCRTGDTRRLLEAAQPYTGPPKTNRNAVANLVTERYLETWSIGGRTLGEIRGDELPELAERMRTQGEGCFVRQRLCLLLIPKVPKNKVVRDCVGNDEVRDLVVQAKGVLVRAMSAVEDEEQKPAHKSNGNGRTTGYSKKMVAATA